MASSLCATEARGSLATRSPICKYLLVGVKGALCSARMAARRTCGEIQADLLVMLGTHTLQLEVDDRMARYVGHPVRLPSDRWGHVVSGEVESGGWRRGAKDVWWEQAGRVVSEVLGEGDDRPWHEVAADRGGWRRLRVAWLHERLRCERLDTHVPREARWAAVTRGFADPGVLSGVWRGRAAQDATGTPLEGVNPVWLKQVILAGEVRLDGWVPEAPDAWHATVADPSSDMWLRRAGGKVRHRVLRRNESPQSGV